MQRICFLFNCLLLLVLVEVTGIPRMAWGSDSMLTDTTRESITFILGEDTKAENQFYTHAVFYYHTAADERTDYIISTARSLLEVRDYLEQHPPRNHQPWGVVNLVVHSNEWSGLSIPIQSDGARTTATLLADAIKTGQFQPLPNSLVDARTDIRIQGCALGRDLPFLELLSRAFGGDDPDGQRPLVRSSKYFLSFYAVQDEQGRLLRCERYLTNFWYAFYPKDQRPDTAALRQQLQTRYPDAPINWEDAITRTQPRYFGDVFHYTYILPLKWFVLYADETSRPTVATRPAQNAWLSAQTELRDYVRQVGIPLSAFAWEIKPIQYDLADHTLVPAIRAYGKSTVLCVLQTFTEPDPANPDQQRPVRPTFDDLTYYSIVVPPQPAIEVAAVR